MARRATITELPRPASERWERWLVLLGATVVILVLGVAYGFSALVEPLKRQFPGWTARDMQMANTLMLLSWAAATVPSGWLQDRCGPRLPVLLGSGLFALAFHLAGHVVQPEQKLLFWWSYGVLYGVGIALATVSPIAALNKWFPEIRGLICGVALMGYGFGAAIFIPTVSAYLAHHTLQEFFRLHQVTYSVPVFLGGLLLRNPPVVRRAEATARDRNWVQMLQSMRFWTLWLLMGLSSTAGLMTIAVAKVAVQGVPQMTPHLAAVAGSVLSMFNAFGRPPWGLLSDRIGREWTFAAMLGLQTVAMLALPWALHTGPGPVFVVFAVVGANFGGSFSLFAPATADYFGTRNLGVNYGWVYSGSALAGIIGPLVAAFYKDTLGVYTPAFEVAAALSGLGALVAVGLSWIVRRDRLAELHVAPVLDFDQAADESWLDQAAD